MKISCSRFILLVGCLSFLLVNTSCISRGKKGKGRSSKTQIMGSFDPTMDLPRYGLTADEEGRLLDDQGRLVLDAFGNPIYAEDISIDASGNLVGPDGKILTDINGTPFTPDDSLAGLGPRPPFGDMEFLNTGFSPVFFSYDSNQVSAGERSKLEAVADFLRQNPGTSLVVEGHCDERGSRDYNLALGERRALAIRSYLINLGIEAARIQTNSFGEEKPAALGHDEASWIENRRAEFVLYN